MKKRTNSVYTTGFKQEAVALVSEQGYSVPKAVASLGSPINYFITEKQNSTLSNQVTT
nr:transposase [Proteus mirabilis]